MKINVIYNIGTFRKFCSYRHLIVCCILLLQTIVIAQPETIAKEIRASLVLGTNFSQLDGDRLSGFDKLGIRSGLHLSFPIAPTKSASVSLLYDQKGSSSAFFNTGFRQFIALDYISFPMSVHWHSWWYALYDDFKINVYGSLIPSRLIATRSSHSNFDNATDQFKKWDISLALGIAYSVSRPGAFHLRIERSLLKIYQVPNATITGLQSYLVTFQFAYLMNKKA